MNNWRQPSGEDAFVLSISGQNLAQGKTATQSSTYGGGTGAANAVDGNTDGNFLSWFHYPHESGLQCLVAGGPRHVGRDPLHFDLEPYGLLL